METTDMQSRSTKERLGELRELFDGGYITEVEFKTARINILDEGGIDVITQLQHTHRPYFQEGEEEPRGSGCGCFLVTLLLAAFLVLGGAFFAAPYWPEEFGGAKAMAAREWLAAKSAALIDKFFVEQAADIPIPDPVSSGDAFLEIPAEASLDIIELASAESADAEPASTDDPVIIPGLPPALSGDTSPQASFTATPIPNDLAISVVEVEEQAPIPTEPSAVPTAPSADLSAENSIRGTVTAQRVRIRSEPDTTTNANVVGWGSSGDRFFVLEEGIGRDASPWYRVIYEDRSKNGWISGSLVRLEQ